MISKDEFVTGRDALLAVLEEPWYSDDFSEAYELFYGYNQEGVLGWHYIYTDYPRFETATLGKSFKEALAAAQGIYEEWKDEYDEDGE